MSNGPKYDIVAVRKDGEEQTFTDYKGEEKTSQFRKVGAVWEREGKLSLSFDSAITDEDKDDCWFNLYARDRNQGGNKGGAKTGKPAAKKGPAPKPKAGPARKPAPPAEDPFDGDEGLDDLDS